MKKTPGRRAVETEAKYVVPDLSTFERLQAETQFGPYTRGGTKVKVIHDRYVDTADHRFYEHKYFVRLRESEDGGSTLATLKQLGGETQGAVHSREEHEAEVPSADIDSWPEGDARNLAKEIAGGAPLVDFVAVAQTRTVSTLTDGDRSVAEVSLDDVKIQTPNEPAMAYELEVELLPDGSLSDLEAISNWVDKHYKLAPQPLSKFERALSLSSASPEGPATAEPAPVAPEQKEASQTPGEQEASAAPARPKEGMGVLPVDSIDVAVRKIIRSYYDDLLKNEEGTRGGQDIEALHDMRVATRRMRAALRVLSPYLDDKLVDRVRGDLRSVTRALGAVRDQDVLIDNAKKFRDHLPAERQADMDGLLSEWSSERKGARKRLLSLLNSNKYTRFRDDVDKFLGTGLGEGDHPPGEDGQVTPHQVRHIAGSAIWERFERVRAFETVMDAPSLLQLHNLRINSKYLRYTLECFREVLPGEVNELIADTVGVQDQLGALHDAMVAAQLVRDYQQNHTAKDKSKRKGKKKADQDAAPAEETAPSDESAQPDGLMLYLIEREATLRQIYTDFAGTWAKIDSPEWRHMLALTVAGV